jgi:co-chaperonin GroES (HSP10)
MSLTDKWRELGLEPLRNNIYIILDEVPKKTAGGLYLSEQQATPTRIGTVLAVGPKTQEIAVGDRVLVGVHGGTNLYIWQYGIGDERWKVFTESEIIARITKEIDFGAKSAEDPFVYGTLKREGREQEG